MSTLAAVVIAAVLGPVILSFVTYLLHVREKRIDWERQDLVAKKAEDAAVLLLAAQKETIRRTDEAAEALLAAQRETIARTEDVARAEAESASEIKGQLKQIHYLVNSDMTAMMQALLSSLQAQLKLDPTNSELMARIDELAAKLEDRLTQTKLADEAVGIQHVEVVVSGKLVPDPDGEPTFVPDPAAPTYEKQPPDPEKQPPADPENFTGPEDPEGDV